MKKVKDRMRVIGMLLCILSATVIIIVTTITMVIQAAKGGVILYPILALLLGSACYYIAVRETVEDKERMRIIIEEIMKADEKDGLYNN